MSANKYYGKYRAQVVDVQDPQKRGRIRVMCPKVLGEFKSSWCEPCIPVAYDLGGDFAIPKVGEFVWVEFEEGNSNKPIYTGGLWCTDKSPSPSYEVNTRLITWGGCKILMSGSALEMSVGGSTVSLTGSSVHITSPSVTVNGKAVARIGDAVTAGTITG